MSIKQHIIDSVVIKSGVVDAHLHGLPQQLDSIHVQLHPDTLLVDVVSKGSGDPIFGLSWDAWSATGEWFGPILVFLLAVIFGWVGRQLQIQRNQRVQVAHFTSWRPRSIKDIRDQLFALRSFTQAINIMKDGSMPSETLLRFQLELDLWIQISPAEMTRIFVVNKKGAIEDNTKDLQDTLTIPPAIVANLEHAISVIKKLDTSTNEFASEWILRSRTLAELSSSIMEKRYSIMQGVDVDYVKALFGKYAVFTGGLLNRWSAIQDMDADLTERYTTQETPAYSALGAALGQMKTSIDQIMQSEDQAKMLLEDYIEEIEEGVNVLDESSARLAALEDRFFLKLL